jgi:hypothetical protein
MIALIRFVLAILGSPFKSKNRLEAENAALRQQLIVLRRRMKGRARLTNADRWFFVQLHRWFPSILEVLTIIRPETLVRWHRAGFHRYWRRKSAEQGGRPPSPMPIVCAVSGWISTKGSGAASRFEELGYECKLGLDYKLAQGRYVSTDAGAAGLNRMPDDTI